MQKVVWENGAGDGLVNRVRKNRGVQCHFKGAIVVNFMGFEVLNGAG